MRGMKIKTEKTNVINKLAGAHLTPGIRGKFAPCPPLASILNFNPSFLRQDSSSHNFGPWVNILYFSEFAKI